MLGFNLRNALRPPRLRPSRNNHQDNQPVELRSSSVRKYPQVPGDSDGIISSVNGKTSELASVTLLVVGLRIIAPRQVDRSHFDKLESSRARSRMSLPSHPVRCRRSRVHVPGQMNAPRMAEVVQVLRKRTQAHN